MPSMWKSRAYIGNRRRTDGRAFLHAKASQPNWIFPVKYTRKLSSIAFVQNRLLRSTLFSFFLKCHLWVLIHFFSCNIFVLAPLTYNKFSVRRRLEKINDNSTHILYDDISKGMYKLMGRKFWGEKSQMESMSELIIWTIIVWYYFYCLCIGGKVWEVNI